MKKYHILYFTIALAGLFGLTSCSETDDDSTEFENWQERNEAYFDNIYATASSAIASGSSNWKLLRKWSLPAESSTYSADKTDYIVVEVLENGTSTSGSPLYTDTVRVSYVGRLMPSDNYPDGYAFDKTYSGNYNAATAIPSKLAVSATVDGFATALQHMVIGDRWRVYIPHQLGYGETGSTSIPAYSTLVFDMALQSYYHPGENVPDFKAKTLLTGE